MDTYFNLPIENQIKKLFSKKILPVLKRDFSENFYEDVTDGHLYQKFQKTIHEMFSSNISTANVFSFTLNTDGISLCEKSKLSVWPVFLTINELDLSDRFFIENVIIAGK